MPAPIPVGDPQTTIGSGIFNARLPANAQIGEALIAQVSHGTNGFSTIDGFTQILTVDAGDSNMTLLIREVDGTEGGVVSVATGASALVSIGRIANFSGIRESASSFIYSTNPSAPSVNAVEGDCVFCFAEADGGVITYDPPVGMTEWWDVTEAQGQRQTAAYLFVGASGPTGTKQFTAPLDTHAVASLVFNAAEEGTSEIRDVFYGSLAVDRYFVGSESVDTAYIGTNQIWN